MGINKIISTNEDVNAIVDDELNFEKSLEGDMGEFIASMRANNEGILDALTRIDTFKNNMILDYITEAMAHGMAATYDESQKNMCRIVDAQKEEKHGGLFKRR